MPDPPSPPSMRPRSSTLGRDHIPAGVLVKVQGLETLSGEPVVVDFRDEMVNLISPNF